GVRYESGRRLLDSYRQQKNSRRCVLATAPRNRFYESTQVLRRAGEVRKSFQRFHGLYARRQGRMGGPGDGCRFWRRLHGERRLNERELNNALTRKSARI